jgi:hypothetical protein
MPQDPQAGNAAKGGKSHERRRTDVGPARPCESGQCGSGTSRNQESDSTNDLASAAIAQLIAPRRSEK